MIFIECDADEVLVRQLGLSRKEFDHQGGKFEICKRLQKTKNSIGLIEHDCGKTDPTYLKKCILVEKRFEIKVFENKASGNKVLVLFNDLEDWVLNVSKNNKVDVGQFGLDSDRNSMHRLMPSRLNAFKRLINKLTELQCPEITFLKSHLQV